MKVFKFIIGSHEGGKFRETKLFLWTTECIEGKLTVLLFCGHEFYVYESWILHPQVRLSEFKSKEKKVSIWKEDCTLLRYSGGLDRTSSLRIVQV